MFYEFLTKENCFSKFILFVGKSFKKKNYIKIVRTKTCKRTNIVSKKKIKN